MRKKSKKQTSKDKEEPSLEELIDSFDKELADAKDNLDEEQEKANLLSKFNLFLQEFQSYRHRSNIDLSQAAFKKITKVIATSDKYGFHDLTAKFAIELSNILLPLQHTSTPQFIDMAVSKAFKIDDKRIKRDILHQAGNNYSKISMFDMAVHVYLEARKYSDVEIDKSAEIQKLMQGGKVSDFGIGSENFYAMMTLKAARCMDPKNDDTLEYFEEAREIYSRINVQGILGVVYFELGIVYDNRAEFEKALESFETAKTIWLKENPQLINVYQINMQIEVIKQKIKSK